ncbi:MAG: hypothetical protein JWN40_3298 [Phycisphaerales bacterium]|nr:hypothetical protein [Phycisphaerales bacterium]
MSGKTIFVALIAILVPAVSFAQGRPPTTSLRSAMFPNPRPPHPPFPPGDGWIWIPPTYRTVYERIWQPPTYQTVTETLWITDQYGWRTICTWEGGQYVQRQEWVLIPAHYETRTRQILVSPGAWTWGPRQELVTPGHWERIGPIHPPVPVPFPQPQPPTARPPGLEPFSPLWEWPADKK